MTSTNARQLIAGACRLFAGLAQGETPTADEESEAYAILNAMIDEWATQPWTTYTITRTTFSIISGTATVTIGATGTVALPRPERLLRASYLIPSSNPEVEVPVQILSNQDYEAMPLKTLTSTLPRTLFYNPTSPNGTMTIWPVVTQTVTMVIYTEAPLAQFTDLTTATIFPPGYANTLKYQLSKLLAPEWGMNLPDGIKDEADRYFARLKRANFKISTMANAWPYQGGIYDIFSDTVR